MGWLSAASVAGVAPAGPGVSVNTGAVLIMLPPCHQPFRRPVRGVSAWR